MHVSYKPTRFLRILFRSGGHPRKFSFLKKFRALVVPGGVCRKGKIIQGIHIKCRLYYVKWSCFRRKGDATGASVHEPRQRLQSTQIEIQVVYLQDQIIQTPSTINLLLQRIPPGIPFKAPLHISKHKGDIPLVWTKPKTLNTNQSRLTKYRVSYVYRGRLCQVVPRYSTWNSHTKMLTKSVITSHA